MIKGSKEEILTLISVLLGMLAVIVAHSMKHSSGAATTLAAGGMLVTILSLAFEFALWAAWFWYLLGVGLIVLLWM